MSTIQADLSCAYTWSLRACDNETIDGKDYTWISCFVTAHDTGITRYIGSLRFEGKDLTFWDHHSAFVEVYSTAKIPRSEIPEVKVTFGYSRINASRRNSSPPTSTTPCRATNPVRPTAPRRLRRVPTWS